MNEFDQFVKHELRVRHYARYTDDFVIVADDRAYLERMLPRITDFLNARLALSLHPNKVHIRKYRQGIDFLGYVCLPGYTLPRAKTRRRIFRSLRKRVAKFRDGELSEETVHASLGSYLGVLSHADAYERTEDLKNSFWFWKNDT
jgi:RNA-directed DNA polymerase